MPEASRGNERIKERRRDTNRFSRGRQAGWVLPRKSPIPGKVMEMRCGFTGSAAILGELLTLFQTPVHNR